jgi:hypothetical protein
MRFATFISKSKWITWLPGLLLLGVFATIIYWFWVVDFYHQHFFDRGVLVVAENAARVSYVAILSWLIYAPGAGAAMIVVGVTNRRHLTPAEWAVLCFSIGVGLWHVVMFGLGLFNLYYRAVMVGLALAVLLVSAKHFVEVVHIARRALVDCIESTRQGRDLVNTASTMLVLVGLVWVLLTRGLYPGGGGDYYTHYFYYYLEVLKHHGLTPNDVWYHYYYSKGYGLFFLSMLLTDPEAPALVTFCCVAFAAIAIATIVARMAPRSLWPASGALLYLLFYSVNFGQFDTGAFQKDHELVSALIVLFAWALSMEMFAPPLAARISSAMSGIAVSIVCQPAGIFLVIYTGLLSAWALLKRRWADFWGLGLVAAAIGSTVLVVFAVSYLITGLATDLELELSLRFANFARLDSWGVLPQLISILWILDNLNAVAPSFGWDSLYQVARFMRLNIFWPYLAAPLVAIALSLRKSKTGSTGGNAVPRSIALQTFTRIGTLVAVLATISLVGGQVRNISYLRFSTFFVPLLVLLTISVTALVFTRKKNEHPGKTASIALPLAMLAGVLVYWQTATGWGHSAFDAARNAVLFATGRYSLADAYKRIPGPSALNPGALAAAQQLPPNTPIWSTSLETFCMAPGCLIESVVSFKMSGRLDEILGGKPDRAKKLLQEAGLNYFLFSKDFRLRDLLPHSKLFAPDTIADYLGVKWSDGSTYLLTWRGPGTKPISAEFLEDYKQRLDRPEESWFLFKKLAQQIIEISPALRSEKASATLRAIPWREAPNGTVDIISATYGQKCQTPFWQVSQAFRPSNATRAARDLCQGRKQCHLTVDVHTFPEAQRGCGNDFALEYRCSRDTPIKTVLLRNSDGQTIDLACDKP